MAELIMRRGPDPGRTFRLSADTVQIGRGTRNEIVIIDNEVSREHCRLIRNGSYYEIEDLASSNGTFVNGQRVYENWPLQAACIIELGDSITLEFKPDNASSAKNAQKSAIGHLPSGPDLFLIVQIKHSPMPAVYPLEGDKIDIGRGTNNQIIIVEPEISRSHLRLTQAEAGYVIRDLGSTNGTSINGTALDAEHLLRSGDVLNIGETITMRFTDNPHEFLSTVDTDLLAPSAEQKDITEQRRQRRTVTTNILSPPPKPSEVGTGIETLTDHVLILYDRADWEAIVAPMVAALQDAEVKSWVEQYLVPGAEDWLAAVEQARLECWLLIVVISPEIIQHDYVMKIWRHFHNREKPVILFEYKPVDRLPIGARRSKVITHDVLDNVNSLQQLVQVIKLLQ
jgi:pSer/pThr/pTyr-binding forkhead associated (FHA) protein